MPRRQAMTGGKNIRKCSELKRAFKKFSFYIFPRFKKNIYKKGMEKYIGLCFFKLGLKNTNNIYRYSVVTCFITVKE